MTRLNKYSKTLKITAFFFWMVVTSVWLVPFNPSMPSSGIDPSWMLAMNQAVVSGLSIGEQLIFTFGPYASLHNKLYHPEIGNLTLFVALFFSLCLSTLLYLNFKHVKWIFQFLLILLISLLPSIIIDSLFLIYPLLVFSYYYRLTSTNCLLNEDKDSFSLLQYFSLILVSIPFGLLPLIKGTISITCIGILLLSMALSAFNKDKLSFAIFLLTPIFSIIFFWNLSGQPLDNIPYYFSNLMPIIRGYSDAMASFSQWGYALFYAFCALLVLIQLISGLRQQSFSKEKILLLVLAFSLELFVGFKAGFVRHDAHAYIASATMLLVFALGASFYFRLTSLVGAFPVLFLIVLIDQSHLNSLSIGTFTDVAKSYVHAWQGIKVRIFDADSLDKKYSQALARLQEKVNFPQMAGTTDIYSYDQSLLLSSKNTWNPRPVFQSYSTYTPALIEKNKQHLESENRPDNIIFKLQTIDGRYPSLDDGASWDSLLTHYQPEQQIQDYLILKQRTRPSFPFEKTLLSDKYKFGETVKLPVDNGMVFAKFNIRKSVLGKIASILFKSSLLKIKIKLSDGRNIEHRLISGMTKNGFLLTPYVNDLDSFKYLYDQNKFGELQAGVHEFQIAPDGYSFLWKNSIEVELYSVKYNSPTRLQDSLVNIDRLLLVSNKTNLVIDDSCYGAIDMLNGKSISPSNMSLHSILNIHGWYFDVSVRDDFQVPKQRFISFLSETGQHFIAPVSPALRPDVADAFHSEKLIESGYKSIIDISSLNGKYKLGLSYLDDDEYRLCSPFSVSVHVSN